MSVLIGLVIAIGSMLGGFVAMGGHLIVIWQPWEYVIICGMAAGTFVIANPMKTVVDSGRASMEALTGKVPKRKDYLALLGLLADVVAGRASRDGESGPSARRRREDEAGRDRHPFEGGVPSTPKHYGTRLWTPECDLPGGGDAIRPARSACPCEE